MHFFSGSQSPTSRPRSVAGVASALAVLLSFPLAILGQALGVDPTMTVHLFLGIGTLLAAYSAFQFGLPRWMAWAGCVSATGLGVIFLLQSLTELTKNDSLRSVAYGVLGQWPEGLLGDLVIVWFFAPLLLVSSGRTKRIGLLVLPIVAVLTLLRQAPGVSLGETIPGVVPFLLAFAWFLFESMQSQGAADDRAVDAPQSPMWQRLPPVAS